MRQEVRYNLLKITGPGYVSWNKKYVYEMRQKFEYVGIQSTFYGDGESEISFKKFKQNLRKLSFWVNNILFITAHGCVKDGHHKIRLNNNNLLETCSIFKKLRNLGNPVFILLASCYGGACESAAHLLPPGSMIFTTALPSEPAYVLDGEIIALALAKLKSSNIAPDLAMYMLVQTYLSNHENFMGNYPSLIIRGSEEVVVKPLEEVNKYSLQTSSSFPSFSNLDNLWSEHDDIAIEQSVDSSDNKVMSALEYNDGINRSKYGEFFSVHIKEILLNFPTLYWQNPSFRNSQYKFFIDFTKYLSDPSRLALEMGSGLKNMVRVSLNNSTFLMHLTQNEDEQVQIAAKFRINNKLLLMEALRSDCYKLASTLIENNTNFTGIEIYGRSLLQFALENYNENLALTLINHGHPLQGIVIDNKHVAFHIVRMDSAKILVRYLERCLDVNLREYSSITSSLLHCAGHECSRLLISRGSDPLIENSFGLSPIDFSIIDDDLEKFRILIHSHKIDCNFRQSFKETLINKAGAEKSQKILKYIQNNYNNEFAVSKKGSNKRPARLFLEDIIDGKKSKKNCVDAALTI